MARDVPDGRVCAGGEEDLDGVEVAVEGGPVEGGVAGGVGEVGV